ncbi:SAM-dependent methyltransferase [Streptomyces specialis]|uniref:SAM-dependent methyltransferase n=1 Tax=Streptomyces specialis TaxID=498367 RepID=UPI00073F14FC|nr:SAM-dependent methyltransferase [Streptomyces specialis]
MDHTALPVSAPRSAVPSIARMENYLLGGKDHYQIDRQACWRLLALAPAARAAATACRHFLRRAVRMLAAERDLRQFIDFGCGLPDLDNTHDAARRAADDVRTVYVDDDPVIAAHGRARMEPDEHAVVVRARLGDLDAVLEHPDVRPLIDPRKPIAVLLVSVLHRIPDDDDPARMVRDIASRLAPGSAMVISHLVSDVDTVRAQVTDLMLGCTGGRWGRVRTRREVETLFQPLHVLPPGVVDVCGWHPDPLLSPPAATGGQWMEYGGVAEIR